MIFEFCSLTNHLNRGNCIGYIRIQVKNLVCDRVYNSFFQSTTCTRRNRNDITNFQFTTEVSLETCYCIQVTTCNGNQTSKSYFIFKDDVSSKVWVTRSRCRHISLFCFTEVKLINRTNCQICV